MGREWYNWGGSGGTTKSSKRVEAGAGGGHKQSFTNNTTTPSGCMCAVFQLFDFHHLQFPSLNHQTSLKPNQSSSFLPQDDHSVVPKGAEAPRNSLELEEPTLISYVKQEENLNINIPTDIQIKTSGDATRWKGHGAAASDCSSEISSSPGTKTPNLVARLMGLDLLPENAYSPSSSSPSTVGNTPNPQQGRSHFRKKQHKQILPRRNSVDGDFAATGCRSLPETPRISSARRSDVDHHRFSLQINKENMSFNEEMVLSRIRRLKELKVEEESRSPGHYARQIVKQVKESVVGRKFGSDVTNTTVINRTDDQQATKEELVSRFKSKKISKFSTTNVDDEHSSSSPGKYSPVTTSCSPRLKFLETKNNKQPKSNITNDNNIVVPNSHPQKPSFSTSCSYVNNYQLAQNDKPSAAMTKPKLSPLQKKQQRPIKKCKKVDEERFGPLPPSRLKKPPQTSEIVIRNKQEEPFVVRPTLTGPNVPPDKKCKKTPLSNDLLNNITTVPTLLPVKKDPTPPATKVPQKQASNAQESKRSCSSQLSSCSSRSYRQKQEATRELDAREIMNEEMTSNGAPTSTSSTTAEEAEYEYITRILRSTGIDNDNPVSFTRWFSPSHPLDPSIFYHLENFIALTPITASGIFYSSGQLSHKCNRKLLFYLVDEMLVEILRPYIKLKPWASMISRSSQDSSLGQGLRGSHLVKMLCSKIGSYPSAECRVLEDIDGLIDKDLPEKMKVENEGAFEEEVEGIVTEVQKDILDTLIHETFLLNYYYYYY